MSIAARSTMRTGYIQGGINRRWNDLGKTILYVDYRNADDAAVGTSGTNFVGNNATISDSEGEAWGFGAVQKIDNAAMELYIDYKHFEVDVQTVTVLSVLAARPLPTRPLTTSIASLSVVASSSSS